MGIKITNLCKSYKTNGVYQNILTRISYTFESGKTYVITGPSGCGKTTLLNILGLIIDPDSGSYAIEDEIINFNNKKRNSTLRNQTIGYVMQGYPLIPDISVYDNIHIPLVIGRCQNPERVYKIAQKMDIDKLLSKKVRLLSGGQQQRVAISRALITNPQLILADEPTSSLDDQNAAEVMQLFKKIQTESLATIIIASHDQRIFGLADEVILLKNTFHTLFKQ